MSENLQRAARAKAIIEDPLVTEALDGIETEIMERWKTTEAADTEGRERLYFLYRTSLRFRTVFENHLTTGKLAQADLAEAERQRGLMDRIRNRNAA